MGRPRPRSSRARGPVLVLLAALALPLLATPVGAAGRDPAPPLGPPYAVHTSWVTLVDPYRPTPARGPVPAQAGRILSTELFVPGAPGPRPLVVFAHGWNSDPGHYATLLEAWAAAGDVVAAPVLPDSTDLGPSDPVSNYPAQAQDLSFVITSLLTELAGQVDPDRVAVAGHSDGGTDVALLALDPAFADLRIRAYLCLAGEIPEQLPGPWDARTTGALLVAAGTDDEYGLYPRAAQVLATAQIPAKVMVSLAGGDHLGTFVDPGAGPDAMRSATVRFLSAALGPRPPTTAGLLAALQPTSDPALTVTG